MKRNLELIRHILLKLEESSIELWSMDFISAEYSINEINYHIKLLQDNNYIECTDKKAVVENNLIINRLKSAGHDYLDLIRDDTIWSKTKNKLGNFLSSATLDIITSVATSIITSQLGI